MFNKKVGRGAPTDRRSDSKKQQANRKPEKGRDEKFDYKDVARLQRLLTSQGKIVSRKRSGLNSKSQRLARAAVKRARFIGLLPFVT